MAIVSENVYQVKQTEDCFSKFFNKFEIAKALKKSNCIKEKGASAFCVFQSIFILVFTRLNLYQSENMGKAEFKKDVIYRFLNSTHTNWSRFLQIVAKKAYETIVPLTDEQREKVFVLDDTSNKRNRSKKVEMLSRVYDHNDKKYFKGFKTLTLGYSDGDTFLPIGFNTLSTQKAEKHITPMSDEIDKRTNGYKARKNSMKGMIEASIDLLKEAISSGFRAKYLLVDSWFSFPSFLATVKGMGIDTITILKDMPKIYYTYGERKMRLSELYKAIKHTKELLPDGNLYLATAVVTVQSGDNKPLPLRITFIYEPGNKRDWIAIASTDTTLPKEEIARIYGKRWSIEVFFKTVKSYLAFSKEFQGRSFDMVVAHTAIVYTRYIMLAMESRIERDYRASGDLFYLICNELSDITMSESTLLIIEKALNAVKNSVLFDKGLVDQMICLFINSLPWFFKDKLLVSYCES